MTNLDDVHVLIGENVKADEFFGSVYDEHSGVCFELENGNLFIVRVPFDKHGIAICELGYQMKNFIDSSPADGLVGCSLAVNITIALGHVIQPDL